MSKGMHSCAQGACDERVLMLTPLILGGSSVGAGFRYVYNSVVKYDVTPEAGGEAVDKKALDMPKPNVNNIGTAGEVNPKSMWGEGGTVSRIANRIPTINAIAGMHDVFQVRLQEWGDSLFNGGGEWARNILNVPGMPIAAGVTWAGLNDASYLSYDTIRQTRRDGR